MPKPEHHDHHHHAKMNHFNRAFAIAFALNFLFTLIEAIYAIHAHSVALLADAGHNMGDVFGLACAGFANLLLNRYQHTKEKYSYGFKRSTILASLVNALILTATSAAILVETIERIAYPGAVQEKTVIIVACFGIFINTCTALLFRTHHHDLNIKSTFFHLAYDALISLGVVCSSLIIYITGWNLVDPLTSLVIILFMFKGTWNLLKQSMNLMLDAVPEHINLSKVAHYLSNIAGVTSLHDLHIWSLSTQEVALTVHLVMDESSLKDEDFARINHDLHHQFGIQHTTIQVEKNSDANQCGQKSKC